MAKPPQNTGDKPAPKGKKIMVALAFLVGVAAVAAASWFVVLKLKHDEGDDEDVTDAQPVRPKKKAGDAGKASFLALDPFTVNLVPDEGAQFLQVSISLRLDDASYEPIITNLMPQIRNDVLRILSAQRGSDLQTIEGKDKLADKLRGEINSVIEPPRRNMPPPDGPVRSVLFLTFIIQ